EHTVMVGSRNAFKACLYIIFDAHADLRSKYQNNPYSHACASRRLLDESYVDPQQLYQIGIRALCPEEVKFIKENNIKQILAPKFTADTVRNVIKEINDIGSSYKGIYLSIDTDGFDPAFAPEKVRQFNIQQQGEIVIQKDSNSEHVFDLSEQSFTNALISVARKQHDWIIFISGHGERSIDDNSDFGLSTWHKNLQSKGFKIRSQNLIDSPQIPINTKLLVIASPEKPWLAGEINIIKQYLQNGGNILWLNDPSSSAFLRPLAEQLGIEFIPGTVLDPNAKMLGLDDPRFVLITDYANHPVGLAVKSVTLLAEGSAIQQLNETSKDEWHYTNLLNSQPDAWVESHRTDESTAKTQTFNEGKDVHGPVSLGMLIERAKPENTDKFQRIAVIGDADFVANSYVGNVANLDLGMALINWLAEDDTFLSIPVKTSIGTQLTLSNTQSLIIGFGFLFVLPGVLLLIGFLLWWRRRRR
ncbi:hypothetical protein LCGC14_1705650, partial [marine sediment metagenome]